MSLYVYSLFLTLFSGQINSLGVKGKALSSGFKFCEFVT